MYKKKVKIEFLTPSLKGIQNQWRGRIRLFKPDENSCQSSPLKKLWRLKMGLFLRDKSSIYFNPIPAGVKEEAGKSLSQNLLKNGGGHPPPLLKNYGAASKGNFYSMTVKLGLLIKGNNTTKAISP